MKFFTLWFCLFILSSASYAQKLDVPSDILDEMKEERFVSSFNIKDTVTIKIVYPENYDASKKYKVFLGLSGGGQSEKVVNYCYAEWFRSDYFKNYITVLPINKGKKNLRQYGEKEITHLFNCIKQNLNTKESNWLIAGTSNGGAAVFNFLAVEPKLFYGAVVMPGSISENVKVTKDWSHLNILLATGEKDSEDWFNATAYTKKRLKNKTKKVRSMVMIGQGHILPLSYDINKVYDTYFF